MTIKTYLIKSTGEMLIHITLLEITPLWSNGVLEKRAHFQPKNIIWEGLQAWSLSQASESTQFYATSVCFLSLFSCNFDDQLSPNFHRFVILCICWNTPSEDTGLWQLPKVYPAFKSVLSLMVLHHRGKWPKDEWIIMIQFYKYRSHVVTSFFIVSSYTVSLMSDACL